MSSQRELKIEPSKTQVGKIHDLEGPDPTEAEVTAEVKAGKMTWTEFRLFVVHPNHRQFALLFLCACIVGASALFFLLKRVMKCEFGTYPEGETPELLKPRYFIWSTLVSGAGLLSATYLAYVSELLKEQINKLRANNKKLQLNVERLTGAIEGLSQTAKSLGDNVKQLGFLKDQLAAQGDSQNAEFGEILDKSTECFDRIKQTNKDQLATLLKKLAQGCEFLDDEEGLSAEEYEAWRSHIESPVDLPKFEEVTSGNNASFAQIDAAIDKMLESMP